MNLNWLVRWRSSAPFSAAARPRPFRCLPRNDYEAAWKWALSIGKNERASCFADIVKANRQ